MDPGPNNNGFPKVVSEGMSLGKATGAASNPSKVSQVTVFAE